MCKQFLVFPESIGLIVNNKIYSGYLSYSGYVLCSTSFERSSIRKRLIMQLFSFENRICYIYWECSNLLDSISLMFNVRFIQQQQQKTIPCTSYMYIDRWNEIHIHGKMEQICWLVCSKMMLTPGTQNSLPTDRWTNHEYNESTHIAFWLFNFRSA